MKELGRSECSGQSNAIVQVAGSGITLCLHIYTKGNLHKVPIRELREIQFAGTREYVL